jgi:hypothetical protein
MGTTNLKSISLSKDLSFFKKARELNTTNLDSYFCVNFKQTIENTTNNTTEINIDDKIDIDSEIESNTNNLEITDTYNQLVIPVTISKSITNNYQENNIFNISQSFTYLYTDLNIGTGLSKIKDSNFIDCSPYMNGDDIMKYFNQFGNRSKSVLKFLAENDSLKKIFKGLHDIEIKNYLVKTQANHKSKKRELIVGFNEENEVSKSTIFRINIDSKCDETDKNNEKEIDEPEILESTKVNEWREEKNYYNYSPW